jgi:hypothetical protein
MYRNNVRISKYNRPPIKPPVPEYFKENYVIPKDYSTEYIILALVLILIIGTWVVIFYYSKNKPIQNPTTKNLSNQTGDPSTGMGNFYNQGPDMGTLTVYEACDLGDCPTNVYTGEKRCPQNPSIQLLYDPITEVCNPQYSCTNEATPYAIKFDGSTDFAGNCDADYTCRCTSILTTPNYIQSLFTVTNGSILENNPQLYNTWYLTQSTSKVSGQGVNIPITYTDPSNNFYQINYSLLTYITPSNCDTIINNYIFSTTGSSAPILPGDELPIDIGLACINSNPCIQGALAYAQPYTFNSSQPNYTQFDLNVDNKTVPLSCVPDSFENRVCTSGTFSACNIWENRCEPEQAPVFNYATGRIHCVNPTPVINTQTATNGTTTQEVQILIKNATTSPPPYVPPQPIPSPHELYTSVKNNILLYNLIKDDDYIFYLDITQLFDLPIDFPNFPYVVYYQWVKVNNDNSLSPINPVSGITSLNPPVLPSSLYANSIPVSNITVSSGSIPLSTTSGISTITMNISNLTSENSGNYACLVTLWSRYNDAAKTVMTNVISINVQNNT